MKRSSLIFLVVLIVVGLTVWVVLTRTQIPQAAQGVMQQAADMTTTGKVKSNFSLSKRLSIYDINVSTQNGAVTLSGRVPTEIDKDLAAGVAKDTTGVKEVSNQLVVEPGIRPSDETLRENARIADLEIQADLRERLASSPELGKENIQINVKDKAVTLSGEVISPRQRIGAEQVARSLNGVKEVTNLITVQKAELGRNETPGVNPDSTANQALNQQIQFALFSERDNFSDVGAIQSESKDGIVTLSGRVRSKAESALAERIARTVSGVKEVRNQLAITFP